MIHPALRWLSVFFVWPFSGTNRRMGACMRPNVVLCPFYLQNHPILPTPNKTKIPPRPRHHPKNFPKTKTPRFPKPGACKQDPAPSPLLPRLGPQEPGEGPPTGEVRLETPRLLAPAEALQHRPGARMPWMGAMGYGLWGEGYEGRLSTEE